MNKQFIYFACMLFMMAALLAVTAQENTEALSNATVNNATLLNNTTLNASLNETLNDTTIEPVSIANETMIEALVTPAETSNETAPIEIVSAENETATEASESIPLQNETVPAQNVTMPQNLTARAEAVSIASPMPSDGQQEAMAIGSAIRNVFAIGGMEKSSDLFSIGGKAMLQEAYEAGLPAETIMDLSAMPFFV